MKDSFTRMAMLRRARKSIRKRRCRQRRLFERLEVRHLLSGDASPGLRIESTFEADSLLVRFHEGFAGAYVTAPDTSRSLNAVPGLQQIATPEQLNVSQAIESYSLHPGVLYAEPNYSISLSATPNDSSYTDLWGLNNGGQTGGTTDADIDAAEAWDITTGSRDTIVAVVDTGVDYLHPDLAANMWVNPGEVAGDGIDNDGNGFVDDVYGYNFVSNNGNPMDDHDHGTHVAGTIGAVANNGVGVVGVSWDVQIMAVKFLDARGGGSTGNAIAAIQYAVDNGATISNHSWGFNGGFSQALADAIEYARQADHLVIAAAGNGGRDRIGDNNDAVPFYPGNFPNENLISIAATDHNDQLASFSNFGATQVDLGAPGVAILSTTRSGGYETFSGTSMATPHASGVAALLRSAYPGWTYDRVRDRLLDTVDPLDALQGITTTGGRLNAASAVAIDTTGPVVVQQTPAGDVMRAQGSLQISFDERLDTASFTVSDIASFNGPSGPIVPSQIVAMPGTRGKDFEVRFPQQAALGSYELVLGTNILDVFGNPMDSAATLSFNIIPDTVGPYIQSTLPDQATDQPTDRVRVIFDEPIDATTFTPEDIEAFTGPGGTISVLSIEEVSSSEFDVVFPTQDAQGIYQFTVSGDISDPAGNKLDQDRDGLQGEAIDDELTVSFELQRWLYADHVVDFSSQYTTTLWSAAQALGPPDTFNYGDIETAWAPRSENGTSEFLTLGFSEPLLASGVVIRETFGNGFVRSIELRDEKTGLFHLVSQPIDDSRPGTPVDFLVTWPQTSFGADAILITIDTDHDLNAFEEIDSVQLRGWSVPDLDGARVLSSSVSGSTEGPVDRIELSFDEPIADGTFTLEDVSNLVGPEGEVPIEQVNRLTSTRYEVVFPPQSTFGDYSMSVGPDIVDLQGLPMNQDRDEFDGEIVDDAFAIGFRVEKWQYAGEVIDYSSQYSPNSWSASEVLGPPDSPIYGDQRTAWAPANMNGTTEFVSVSFPEPVLSSGVMVRETFGNGFVRGIDLRDADTGGWTSMSIPADQSQPGQPAEYVATWPLTDFEVDGVRVQIDTDQTANFEEIDAIQLRGVPAPDLQGPAIIESDPESGHPGPLDHIDLVFSEAINENTFTAEDVETLRGPSGPILLSSITKLADDRFQLSFPEQTEKGSYQLRIGSAIEDLYGNQMESAFDLFIELELWQYASSVIDFSSQYSATSWSAAQALGAPDTLIYGDARTAWAPSSINGTTETLTLGFDTPVQSSGAIIRQTFGNGFVRQIEVRDAATGNFEVVSTATDTSQPGSPVDYVITWPQTSYPVDAIRITVDTNHSGSFEEIDAVTLRGVVPPDTVGPRVVSTVPNRGMSGPIDHIEVAFSESIDASSFTLDDLSTLTTPNGVVPIQSITPVSESRFRLGFTEQREWGDYSVSIGPGIQDLAGNSMDQNSDGVTDQTDVFELAFALELWQYASSVIDFSSQYSATSWSAEQALGTPDTLTYGDARTAWAPSVASGGTEYLTLGFDDAVLSTGAVVRQTFGNGFVHTIEARDADTGTFVLLFDGVDDSQPGAPVDFVVDWSMTQFPVDALRISVDTSHSFSFEEIDAVQLRGVIAPDFTGPHVLSTNPSASASSPLSAIEVTFDETIDASSVDVGDVVSFVGPNGAVEVNSVSVVNGQRMRIEFDPLEDFGAYSFQVGPGIFDLSGNPMDQDRDGVNGESLDDVYSGQFNLQLEQFAASVIDFTSQYSPFGWSASDALGAPNTFEYGDARTAWAPRYANAGMQSITLGFDTPVYSSGAMIRQTFGNGFVRIVELRDSATGEFHAMPFGTDNSSSGLPVDFEMSWSLTTFQADAIRITIDTDHSASYEEIDAVSLRGI